MRRVGLERSASDGRFIGTRFGSVVVRAVRAPLNRGPDGVPKAVARTGAEDEVIETEMGVGARIPNHVRISGDGKGLDLAMEHVAQASTDQRRMAPNLEGDDPFVWEHAEQAINLHIAVSCFAHGMVDDGARHVDAAGHLDSLQTRAGVHLEHHGSVVAFQQIDTGDVEPKHPGSAAGYVSKLLWQVHRFHGSVEVEVRTEFSSTCTAPHGRHHLVADDNDADVLAVAFGHVFLNQNVPPCVQQALYEALCLIGGVAKEDALALRALGHFDHHGQPSDGLDGVVHVTNVSDVHGARNWDAIPCQNLACTQLVPALKDACSAVGRPNAELIEVTQKRRAVPRDGMPDAWNHRLVLEGLTVHQHLDAPLVDKHRTGQGVDDVHIETTLPCFFDQPSGAVEPRPPGQHGEAKVHVSQRHITPFHLIVHR